MKTMRIPIATIAVLLTLLCLGVSCTPQQPKTPPAQPSTTTPERPTTEAAPKPEAKAPQKKWVIGMSQCNLNEPWRVQMNADVANAAAQHDNLQVIFKDAQNDTLVQRSHVEEFVNQGVNLIIISPKEAVPLTDPVAKAYQAGIPVIVLDRRVVGDQYTVFIGADNKKIGEAAGKWIVRALGGKGKVVELKGLMTSTPGQDRNSGFRKGIEGSDIEVIFEADMQWLEPKAREEMESALARFDQIDLVYGHNDPAAHGAYLAAKAAGREKEMMFVGIDGLLTEGQPYVRQGILNACFEYPTGGKEAIDIALMILDGKVVPKEMTLASRIFTPENIDKSGQWLHELDWMKTEQTPAEGGGAVEGGEPKAETTAPETETSEPETEDMET